MGKSTRIIVLLWALVYFGVSMGVMLVFSQHKSIRIDNVAINGASSLAGSGTEDGVDGQLLFRPGEKETEYLEIPLEAGVQAGNVIIENHYMQRQIWIYIGGTSREFYTKEAIFGNISRIEAGGYEFAADGVLLKFQLDDVYECQSILGEGRLSIRFVPPKEIYDKIVVIDAGCGGEDIGIVSGTLVEKTVTLDIVKRVQALFEGSDIKIYYTRMEDVSLSEKERAAFANAVDADMLISIRLNESETETVFGTETFYNGSYFIPDFGNIELADLVEYHVVTAIKGKANGLYEAWEGDILLREAKVPAVVIRVGYSTNAEEVLALEDASYRDRVAWGIRTAILAAYEIK